MKIMRVIIVEFWLTIDFYPNIGSEIINYKKERFTEKPIISVYNHLEKVLYTKYFAQHPAGLLFLKI